MRAPVGLVLGALALWLTGCRLEEISIPLGREVLVVQGVLTLDSAATAQYVVVEWSLTGTVRIPDQDSLRGPPRPPVPVSNARVIVTRDDGDSVEFSEIADTAGVYRLDAATAGPFLQAGRVYRLRVTVPSPGGQVVTGRMRMPDFPDVTGIPGEGASFNRDHDTLVVRWSGGGATKGVFVQVRPRDIRRRLTLFFFTDSTRFVVPGSLPLPLVGEENPPVVWVAGTRQTFSVAAIDTNLFDFQRSGNNPFTATGFINRLEGALGVFGGAAPVNRTYEVVADSNHPYEGRYRLAGRVDADTIQGTLRLFVTRDAPEPVLVGTLVEDPLGWLAPRAEGAGRVEPDRVLLRLLRDPPGNGVDPERLIVIARRESLAPGGSAPCQIQREGESRSAGTCVLERQ